MMKRFQSLILVALGSASLLFGIAGATTQASAKKVIWHKGTPKTVRGNYKTKHYGADLMMVCKIHSKSLWFWGSGMPVQNGYNVRYKVTSRNHYIIRYDAHASGSFKGGKNLKMPVKKVGKTIRVLGYSNVFRKYSGKF